MYIIWHDNTVTGQRGYTEYTVEEIAARGGIDAIVHDYVEIGVFVYSVDIIRG